MIRKVKFNNFYSFSKSQEINFLTEKKQGYDYFHSKTGSQITKIAGFAGGNASGKTNIMRLFGFFKYFVCEYSKEESAGNLNIAYKTFFNNKKSSDFDIEFEKDGNIYYYNFVIQQQQILRESLHIKKIKKGARKIEVFLRNVNNVEKLHEDYFKKFDKKFLENIRQDISLVAFLKSHYNIEIINNVYTYFKSYKTNINERGEINNLKHQFKSLEIYLEDKDIKKEMENFISHFDIGLSGFLIEKEVDEKKNIISVKGVHPTKEGKHELDFIYESRGTQALFFTLANILDGLKHNNVIVIDEIETEFHPEALNKIIRYFIDENKESSAQMIFTSHSLGFMNQLDMHQIYLVEKSQENESCAYRLNQVDGIRSDENFLSKYMTGIYGAFPKIRL